MKLGLLLFAVFPVVAGPAAAEKLADRNAHLLDRIGKARGLSGEQRDAIDGIFRRSGFIGQGNPAVSRYALGQEKCEARAGGDAKSFYYNAKFAEICGAPFMAPLFDPATETPERAQVCIDQFEYPNIPCEYPVVWVRPIEAAEICAAEGKRLCDAHEWEGACSGALTSPGYRFDLAVGLPASEAVARMREAHNVTHEPDKGWSYGPEFQSGICATGSRKSDSCNGGGYGRCGSNTYPAGSFPACASALWVYDLHGNAAEHMNLPLAPDQMASRSSTKLGVTEMKGSWFIWDEYRAHPDWCRWRAPFWHGSRVASKRGHANYHLGFRCCKSIP